MLAECGQHVFFVANSICMKKFAFFPLFPIFFAAILLCCNTPSQNEPQGQVQVVVQSDTSAQRVLQAANDSCGKINSPKEAIQYLLSVLDSTESKLDPDHDTILADAYHILCVKYYNTILNDKAIEYGKKSLWIRKNMLSKSNPKILKSLRNLGYFHAEINQPKLALEYLLDAKNRLDTSVTTDIRFPILRRLATVYQELGEYDQAQQYFDLALATTTEEKDSATQRGFLSQVMSDYANYNYVLRDFEASHTKASVALENVTTNEERANAQNAIGLATQNLRQLNISIIAFKEAINMFRIIDQIENANKALNNLGISYRMAGQRLLARKTLLSAIEANQKNKTNLFQRNESLAKNYNNLAEVDMDEGHPDAAIAHLQKSIGFLSPGFAPSHSDTLPPLVTVSGDLLTMLDVLRNKARCHYLKYQSNPSHSEMARTLVVYDSLVPLMSRIRSSYFNESSKFKFAEEADSVLSEAVAVCYQFAQADHDPSLAKRAFAFADQSKANTLLEQIRLRTDQGFGNLSSSLLEELKQAKIALDEVKAQLYNLSYTNPTDTKKVDSLNKKMLLCSEYWNKLNDSARILNPAFRRMQSGQDALNPAQVQQQLLDKGQALVEYKFARGQCFAFMITKDTFSMVRIGSQTSIAASVGRLREGILKGYKDSRWHASYCEEAWALYQTLIAPLGNAVDGLSRLVIVPEDVLNQVPFEALLTQKVDPVETPGAFLLQRFSISYGFSAGLLLEMKNLEPRAGLQNRVATFAPTFKAGLRQGTKVLPPVVSSLLPFQPMMWSKEEIAGIAKEVRTEEKQGLAATKSAFEQACASNSVVHVSTHAFLNDDKPDYSFLVFTQNADTLQESELLYLRQLNSMTLQNELIVFTACRTLLGKNQRAEGAMSMARGLALAEVKSFVATLWEVNQEKTAALIPYFYRFLGAKEARRKDEALADAKRFFVKGNSKLDRYPYFWAGFTISGDMKALNLKGPSGTLLPWAMVVVAGLVAIAGAFYFRNKKKKR